MGGTCSTIRASIVMPTSMSTNASMNLQTIHFIENCRVIWLIHDETDDFEYKQLCPNIYGTKKFTDPNTCLAYIKDIVDERIFLVISNKWENFECFSSLEQIEKIYTIDYNTRQEMLIDKIERDIELCEFDSIHLSTVSVMSKNNDSTTDFTEEEAPFMLAQHLNKLQSRLKFESRSKDVFIEFCRLNYADFSQQMAIIEEFAKIYRPSQAIDWLRRSCFISKIFNRATCTYDIDILYKLGFFAKHIHTQLKNLYETNRFEMKNIQIVYRGKTMSKYEYDELLKPRLNGFMSFSNFLFTNTSRNSSLNFIRNRLTDHSNRIGILFEIYLNHSIFIEQNPYALVKRNNTDDDNICFSVATIFRIISIDEIVDNSSIISIVKLEFVQNHDEQLIHLLKPLCIHALYADPFSLMGKILAKMDKWKHVQRNFRKMLNDSSIQSEPHRLVHIQTSIASFYYHKCNYETALHYYKQVLQISLTYLSSDHFDLASIYRDLGNCYLKMHDYNLALKHCKMAIELMKQNTQSMKSNTINQLEIDINSIEEMIKNEN